MIYVECKERKEFVKLTDISLCTVMLDNEGQIELQVKDDKDKLMWRVMMIAESKIDAQRASRSSNLQVLHNTASADLFDFNIL